MGISFEVRGAGKYLYIIRVVIPHMVVGMFQISRFWVWAKLNTDGALLNMGIMSSLRIKDWCLDLTYRWGTLYKGDFI